MPENQATKKTAVAPRGFFAPINAAMEPRPYLFTYFKKEVCMSVIQFQVTRTAYCPTCARRGSPIFGQWYAIFGTRTQTYYFGWAEYNSADTRNGVIARIETGFTPHLFVKVKTCDDLIVYQRICLMHKCGIEVRRVKPNKRQVVMQNVTKQAIYESGCVDGKPKYFSDLMFQPTRWLEGTMEIREWNALVCDWKHTGYYL